MAYINGKEVLFSAILSGYAAQLTLNAPRLSIDLYTATLTILDSLNGNFAGGYKIYKNDALIATVTEKNVLLTDYAEVTEDATIKVCAVGENFKDSEFATIKWTKPPLYAPTIAINNITDTLTITDTNGVNASGFAIYANDTLIATVTETTVVLSNYMEITKSQSVKVKAVSGNDNFSDSTYSNSVMWIAKDSGTEGLKYRNVLDPSTYVVIAYECWGYDIDAVVQQSTVISSYYNKLPVIAVNANAFSGKVITSVSIPDTVEKIRYNAFYKCTQLASVRIGLAVTFIDDDAFYGCTALTDVYYNGTEEEWAAITINHGNEPLTNATIHYNS